MNLQLVTGTPFVAICINCGQRSHFGDVFSREENERGDVVCGERIGGFADLDGKSFVAYYCNTCGKDLLRGASHTGDTINNLVAAVEQAERK